MKVYLAGNNGKARILSLYESIFSKRNKESIPLYAETDRQTDRQTDSGTMKIYQAGGISGNLRPYFYSIIGGGRI